jgi:helix-turn-helix protein
MDDDRRDDPHETDRLGEDEKAVLLALDGRMEIESIAARTGLPEHRIASALQNLIHKGLVKMSYHD